VAKDFHVKLITGSKQGNRKISRGQLWGRIFILDFAYISRKFPSDPRLFPPENEEISTPPPCGFLI
jgi:hypothetical protein